MTREMWPSVGDLQVAPAGPSAAAQGVGAVLFTLAEVYFLFLLFIFFFFL